MCVTCNVSNAKNDILKKKNRSMRVHGNVINQDASYPVAREREAPSHHPSNVKQPQRAQLNRIFSRAPKRATPPTVCMSVVRASSHS